MDEFNRPTSEQLTDLHVYVIPPDHWRTHLHSAVNQIINEAVSAGFVRVLPENTLSDIRGELELQLEHDVLPREFIFLKSVGRCLTRVRPKQEFQLKVKNFLPPLAYAPEIFVLEGNQEITSVPQSSSSSIPPTSSLDHYPVHNERDAFIVQKPVPPISDNVSQSDIYKTTKYSRPSNSVHEENMSPKSSSLVGLDKNNPVDTYERYEQVRSPKHNIIATSHSQQNFLSGEGETYDKYTYKQVTFKNTPSSNAPAYKSYPKSELSSSDLSHGTILISSPFPTHTYPQYYQQGEIDVQEYLPPFSASPPTSTEAHGHPRSKGYPLEKSAIKQSDTDYHAVCRTGYQTSETLQLKDSSFEQPLHQPTNLDSYEVASRSLLSPVDQYRFSKLRQRNEAGEDENLGQQQADDHFNQQMVHNYVKNQEQLCWEEEQEINKLAKGYDEHDHKRMENAEHPGYLPRTTQLGQEDNSSRHYPLHASNDSLGLKEQLRQARQERQDVERQREEFVKRAKQLQNRTQQKRNQARDMWKKKYFEEKKRTSPAEEHCNKLKYELETIHRKIMSQLEGTKDQMKRMGDNKPSHQSNLKIQATRLRHDIDDLQRRVENVKMKLTTEMKLRNQAQGELKALRAELTQKKIGITLARNQQQNHLHQSQDFYDHRQETMISP